MPYYELRHRLGMEGKGPDDIARGVEAAYARGELPNAGREAGSPICSRRTSISGRTSAMASSSRI